MKHEKKSNLSIIIITVLITIVVMFIILFTFLFSMGDRNKSINTAISSKDSESITSNSKSSSNTTSDSITTSESIDTKKLTTSQIEDWINAVLSVSTSPYKSDNYYLDTEVNDTDNLVYVTFGIPQTDPSGFFRVNSQGNLEISLGWAGPADWDIISTKYMDTSIAENYFNEKQQSHETNSSNTNSQSLDEDFFYNKIKKARDDEQAYIDSIEDPKLKQSVQTAYSASIFEATRLEMDYPDKKDLIDSALKRVLAGN